MEQIEVRLECLKLAHRHDRSLESVVDNAKIYEQYVLNQVKDKPVDPPTAKAGQDPKGKKA